MIGFIFIITIVIVSIFNIYLGNKIKKIIIEELPNEYLNLSNNEGSEKTISPQEALLIKLLWKRKYKSLNNKNVTFLCNILLATEVLRLALAILLILYVGLGIFINAT